MLDGHHRLLSQLASLTMRFDVETDRWSKPPDQKYFQFLATTTRVLSHISKTRFRILEMHLDLRYSTELSAFLCNNTVVAPVGELDQAMAEIGACLAVEVTRSKRIWANEFQRLLPVLHGRNLLQNDVP